MEETEKQEIDKTKVFEDEEVIKPFDLSVFVSKEEFLTPREVVLDGVMLNKFGRPELKFLNKQGHLARVPISKSLHNELIEEFGSTNAQIRGNKVTLKAEKVKITRDNETIEGFQLVRI